MKPLVPVADGDFTVVVVVVVLFNISALKVDE